MDKDCRLIEDYLPVQKIGEAASSEPRIKGHISTMHVWRARRPLIACRAAVYSALVPASLFVPGNGAENRKKSLGRANATKFVQGLCRYPGAPTVIAEARNHILKAHAERLSLEKQEQVTPEGIIAGYAPRPRVLDMFAGGGAIPLEAARLGCETYAIELNPVAYIIELCTVKYPQEFGPALADEVEQWGRTILTRVSRSVTSVMWRVRHGEKLPNQRRTTDQGHSEKHPDDLSVVANLWTRTAPCPNPVCGGTVPLYRQTWLRKKSSGYVALKPLPDKKRKVVTFEVATAASEASLGFDPSVGSESSSTVCPFCQTVLDGKYVREYGEQTGFGQQLMCVIGLNPQGTGKLYLSDETIAHKEVECQTRAEELGREIERELGKNSLDEAIPPTGNAGLATGNSYLYGIRTFRQAFTPRQRLILLAMAREIACAHKEMLEKGVKGERAKAIATYLGIWLSRLTDRFNGLARWDNSGEKIQSLTSMKRFAMTWDFPELNLFGGGSGDAWNNLLYVTAVIRKEHASKNPVQCVRCSATDLPFSDGFFDAVITDPPYYDNESYSELSDVCYVWLKLAIGFLYPEHFGSTLTPKKKECVAAAYRQGGKAAARNFFESTLRRCLTEANRVTKNNGLLVVVYAHKTTLGWATLVESLRQASYEVTNAWPLDTETKSRVAHQGDAALVSSIFIVARKREGQEVGNYETLVRPLLETIVRERVTALWEAGISGADLIIACVGSGLRAFTRFARVEYANGELVPAESFLMEVEAVVLECILEKLSKHSGAVGNVSLSRVDPNTRFYLLWRYTYKAAEVEAGEAIVFANGTHVELDGPGGLSSKVGALLLKKKGKYKLRDFSERGDAEELGKPSEEGQPAPLIDSLHRVLWLLEYNPGRLPDFLAEAQPNLEQMRLVAQALVGPVLKGSEMEKVSPTKEMEILSKLTSNWRSVLEDRVLSALEKEGRKFGQRAIPFGKGGQK